MWFPSPDKNQQMGWGKNPNLVPEASEMVKTQLLMVSKYFLNCVNTKQLLH